MAITKSVEQTFKPFFDKMKADVLTLSDTDPQQPGAGHFH